MEQLKAIVHHDPAGRHGNALIGALVKGAIGLRIPPEIERQGLDINEHGEEGYMTSGLVLYERRIPGNVHIEYCVCGDCVAGNASSRRSKLQPNQNAPTSFSISAGTKLSARHPVGRIVLRNQDALRSAGGLVGRKGGGRLTQFGESSWRL